MRLVKHSQINLKYFEEGSRPSKQQWRDLIEENAIGGKIIGDLVLVDVDDFMSRPSFYPNHTQRRPLDLLA